ncbi:MAG: hypothetical protein WA774_05745, partial [Candidatus Acidiferrales bacterium]
HQFARSCRWSVALIQLITPVVENSTTYPHLSCEPDDVVAHAHSLNRLSPKLVAVPLSFLWVHFAAPFPQSVHRSADELEWPFTSIRGESRGGHDPLYAELLGCHGQRETISF